MVPPKISTIKEMGLHSEEWFVSKYGSFHILKVPGGWIYTINELLGDDEHSRFYTSTFVKEEKE